MIVNSVKSHKDLKIWLKSLEVVIKIYKMTANFPESEKYGLASQMRRASVSVSSNISEGCARGSTGEFLRYLNISFGSLAELDTQCIIAQKLNYIKNEQNIFEEIRILMIMTKSLIKKLQSKTQPRNHSTT